MSRVLVLGNDLPFFYPGVQVEAAHYRTWQFVDPLIADGHTLLLAAEHRGMRDAALTPRPAIPSAWEERFHYRPIDLTRRGWIPRLQKVHDEFRPDCIVAVNFYPCLYATRLTTPSPRWMDIYGDMLTILQAIGYRRRNNGGQAITRHYLADILRDGDVFSACGEPQQHILVGEMGMVGRLNWQSFGYRFSRVILPGAAPLDAPRIPPGRRSYMASLGLPPDAFVVLWAGGYNTWTDAEVLYRGLEWAMGQDANVHFVSLGASTYDAADNVYERFRAMIANSPHRGHFHLLGWRPWEDLPACYAQSDVGVNIDFLHYETVYGTRTRLLEMIGAGLPVITSLCSDLSYRLQAQGIGLGFEIGDWLSMGRHIARLSRQRGDCQALSEKARLAAQGAWSFKETTHPLREWVRSPQHAPDHLSPDSRSTRAKLMLRARVRQLLWKITGADR